jgi:hypothetical protein
MFTILVGIFCFLAGPVALYFAARYSVTVKARLFEILENIEEKQNG